jgi:hypothetical protein
MGGQVLSSIFSSDLLHLKAVDTFLEGEKHLPQTTRGISAESQPIFFKMKFSLSGTFMITMMSASALTAHFLDTEAVLLQLVHRLHVLEHPDEGAESLAARLYDRLEVGFELC